MQIRYDLEVLAAARRIAAKKDSCQSDLRRYLHDESVFHTSNWDIVKSYLAPETRVELMQIIRQLPKRRRK